MTGDKRTPAKSRRTRANCPHHAKPERGSARRGQEWDDRHAPGHMGGSFDDAGYRAGSGAFGFRIDPLP